MVHVRINERESNPNPHVNFISVLPVADSSTEQAARQLMRALAAQVKPVMAAHGLAVNSFEEYEYNRVFAGRNWNGGETIELVLKSASGALLPTHWLMSTLCHELAHNKHMNHGPAFQALWKQLRNEVRALQNKGYYGDGYWSSGTRLADSARVAGQGIEGGDLPEYMCGGAQSRARPTSFRRRRRRAQAAGPSNHSGVQTAKKRKAGSRVAAETFGSGGTALNADTDADHKDYGTGFRKKANSKRAREERAIAAERRLQGLASSSSGPSKAEDTDSGSDTELVGETDQDRRRIMLDAMAGQDLDDLRVSRLDFSSDFNLPQGSCGMRSTADSGSAFVDEVSVAGPSNLPSIASSIRRGKQHREEAPLGVPQPSKRPKTLGDFISPPSTGVTVRTGAVGSSSALNSISVRAENRAPTNHEPNKDWACLVCTLTNAPGHLACSACSTPRGDSEWVGGVL
ncbi:WLM-domain-containing protein [Leucogyrophana mollusca]|uniref:WLM-domain-containing protein n=1 Tax=Leucogyrophana mollusca TaxID=85980 RepID=A0ACB8BQI9_9AGAM|nr:WLM-domain-containing protein [Leucogyrophana mollusca]